MYERDVAHGFTSIYSNSPSEQLTARVRSKRLSSIGIVISLRFVHGKMVSYTHTHTYTVKKKKHLTKYALIANKNIHENETKKNAELWLAQ